MKNFLLFLLISANNYLLACGYYPFGDDTRFSLFNPTIFGYQTYSNFHYSTNSFTPNEDLSDKESVLPNIRLWFDYCRGKVDIQSIDEAIYQLAEAEVDEHSRNEMIQYLYQQKDKDALNYLRFAKNCEFFNSWQEDPWERKTYLELPKRTELMNRAVMYAGQVQHKALKNRYTFLAIRLAWYNHQYDNVRSLFATVFEGTKHKDILYYWSLYFKSFTEKEGARANFDLAQVFANAVDKRFVCHQHFHSKVSLEQTLRLCKNGIEEANVYLLYGIEKPDKALPYLQKMYGLNPASDGLSFLLLREINKIEDYVFTPYYTLFQPSLSYDYWSDAAEPTTRQTLNRAERDRLYAKEVLHFVNSVDFRKVENPFLWQSCKAYLQFITREYNACLTSVQKLENSITDNKLIIQAQIIKALALTARQAKGHAVIPAAVQSTLIVNQKNGRFIFAIGKELEYLGNTTDAALLYAKLMPSECENPLVFWKTSKNKKYPDAHYYEDYFDYADAVYTPEQTQYLIEDIHKNKDNKDSFSVFKYGAVQQDIPRLNDLLGTKYIRQNKLEIALATFAKIDNRYWSQTYTWCDDCNNFDRNPFYILKYTPQFIIPKDTILLNKYTITKQLLTYLHKAENIDEKDRDYYYFLVANVYYNMGQEGNVSMMRRISGWSDYRLSVIEDEPEFRQSNLAKKYYLLAKQYAKTAKFKALCLRMAVRCEENKSFYRYLEDNDDPYDQLLATNQYQRELKEKYPDYFDDLDSNCDNFKSYFEARR